LFENNQEKDLEEKSYQRCEHLSTLDYIPKVGNKNPKFSIQEENNLPHATWEGNCDLSYT
jgi:hypothetical protein